MILDSYYGSKFYNGMMFLFFEKNEKESTYETCSLWDSFFFFKKKNMSNVKQFLLMTKQVTEEIIANLKCCDPAFVKS